ncbi:cell division ATP-binding protein FtsE [Candidatus Falkowbacteria bacterium RIFOXYD2_FULL_35_9]|uniref:Cell division ATP-binding protein FtsE n=1 Tax=Candidatus Falkowbacteria bacterium RIFOXYC2_FULL_36_12 TaxID=1798002 RepID=A0A1F5T232_9BACT|nr:MAG: cell division ATP-binding protein FtsE [Candidatus Falkowbacteria bacterium RIFOXYB2_FULL_35_7]OGF32511.1 MAG: cell division ATP-binding protein FtsE [Candidatus Falkowbacteria bacterium RIFOXYC2_FULL_36_12]OGF45973.1 MAG: cell division ATP-binding protein FtsE [Candidatus Falkowbacteria bacterium RIFOXYD2_FULL_35_9]
MIKLRQVSKLYPPDTYALHKVDMHIKDREFVSVIGQSGTGKTTLIKILTAQEKPTHGRIIVGGWDITDIAFREIPILRRQIGVIYQDFKLLPRKTIFENIAFALQVCGTSRAKITKVVPQVLKIVGLHSKAERYPGQLSGGEQQRVAIARALVHHPQILLADEPTGNLDSINTREIIELLKKINELGTTVMLVTHNKEVVNLLKKRVITLDQGKLVSDQKVGKYML